MQPESQEVIERDELRVFSKDETRARLGGISDSYYYELRAKGLLRFSRLKPGGLAVHTGQQISDYIEYLNTDGQVAVDELAARRRVGARQRASARTA